MIRPILTGASAWPGALASRSATSAARAVPVLGIDALLSVSTGLHHGPVRGVKARADHARSTVACTGGAVTLDGDAHHPVSAMTLARTRIPRRRRVFR